MYVFIITHMACVGRAAAAIKSDFGAPNLPRALVLIIGSKPVPLVVCERPLPYASESGVLPAAHALLGHQRGFLAGPSLILNTTFSRIPAVPKNQTSANFFIQVDYDQLHKLAGYSTAKVACTIWGTIKKKL
jgi:hypothetical protein